MVPTSERMSPLLFLSNTMLRPLVALLLVTLSVFAQDEVSFRFRIASWLPDQPAGFTYIHKGKPVQVEGLSHTVRSDMYDYYGPALFNLYPLISEIQTGNSSGELPKPIASIRIPTGMRYPFLILIPNQEGKEPPYRIMVLDDDPSGFPYPSYNIVNFSSKPVAIAIGDKQFELDPGKRRLITSEQKTLNLRLAIPRNEEKDWKVVYDNFYPNWPEERTLMFVVDITKNGQSRTEPRVFLENKIIWQKALTPNKESSATDE